MDQNQKEHDQSTRIARGIMIAVASIIILGMVSTLTGCATTPQVKVVEKVETRVLTIPEPLTTPVTVTKPPSVKLYVAGTRDEKEDMMTKYINSLLKDIGTCNGQLNEIKLLQVKQMSIINTKDTQ